MGFSERGGGVLKSSFVQNVMSGALVICALLVAISVVHREFFISPLLPGVTGQEVKNWAVLAHGRVITYGSGTAVVTILDFSDYECPYCKSMEGKLAKIADKLPGKIRVIRFEDPLVAIHHNAYTAAIAAKCAEQQHVVSSFQKLVYAKNTQLNTFDWLGAAKNAGVRDLNAFNSCLSDKKTAPLIDKDMALASDLNFNGTPILVINGEVVNGNQSEQEILDIVKSKADQAASWHFW